MTAITFDSLAYSKRLRQAGMPSEQADALAELTRQHDDLWLARTDRDKASLQTELDKELSENNSYVFVTDSCSDEGCLAKNVYG